MSSSSDGGVSIGGEACREGWSIERPIVPIVAPVELEEQSWQRLSPRLGHARPVRTYRPKHGQAGQVDQTGVAHRRVTDAQFVQFPKAAQVGKPVIADLGAGELKVL